MAKQIRYTVEAMLNGVARYYKREVSGASYVDLEQASSTADFAELGGWKDYVNNDFNAGSVDSFQVVELELKVKNANVDAEINTAIAARAMSKLTQLEKDALGL